MKLPLGIQSKMMVLFYWTDCLMFHNSAIEHCFDAAGRTLPDTELKYLDLYVSTQAVLTTT